MSGRDAVTVFAAVDWAAGWYPGNAMELFRRASALRFVDSPTEADVVWIFSYYVSVDLPADGNPRAVIASFHHLYRPKEPIYLPHARKLDRAADVIHFFSERNARACWDYFMRSVVLLPYWIDTDRFAPASTEERAASRRALGLPDDRLVLGSFQRDTEADRVTPKFEKGPDVFCDVVQALPRDRVFVLLAGPRRDYVERRLAEAGLSFASLGPVPHAEMHRLYASLDRYLVTSRVEGGPQGILESMATATPVLSTPVGVADLLAPPVVCHSTADFVRALTNPYPDVLALHRRRVMDLDYRAVVPRYDRFFEGLADATRRGERDLPVALPEFPWFAACARGFSPHESGNDCAMESGL